MIRTQIGGSVHHDFAKVGKQGISDDDNFIGGVKVLESKDYQVEDDLS